MLNRQYILDSLEQRFLTEYKQMAYTFGSIDKGYFSFEFKTPKITGVLSPFRSTDENKERIVSLVARIGKNSLVEKGITEPDSVFKNAYARIYALSHAISKISAGDTIPHGMENARSKGLVKLDKDAFQKRISELSTEFNVNFSADKTTYSLQDEFKKAHEQQLAGGFHTGNAYPDFGHPDVSKYFEVSGIFDGKIYEIDGKHFKASVTPSFGADCFKEKMQHMNWSEVGSIPKDTTFDIRFVNRKTSFLYSLSTKPMSIQDGFNVNANNNITIANAAYTLIADIVKAEFAVGKTPDIKIGEKQVDNPVWIPAMAAIINNKPAGINDIKFGIPENVQLKFLKAVAKGVDKDAKPEFNKFVFGVKEKVQEKMKDIAVSMQKETPIWNQYTV